MAPLRGGGSDSNDSDDDRRRRRQRSSSSDSSSSESDSDRDTRRRRRKRHDSDDAKDARKRQRHDSSDSEKGSKNRHDSPEVKKERHDSEDASPKRDAAGGSRPEREWDRGKKQLSASPPPKRREKYRRSRSRSRSQDDSRRRDRRRDRSRDRQDDRRQNRRSSRSRRTENEDRRERQNKDDDDKENKNKDDPKGKDDAPAKKKAGAGDEMVTTKTGGAYIPPAKLRMMQQSITDKNSEAFQRLAWQALKKSINGLINKVNSPNIAVIVRELFAENIVRGRGLLCQSIIQAQTASPTFTHVYASLAGIINSKFPNIGELLLKRLIINFKRGFKRNDKLRCTSSVKFLAHLVNQQVAHEVLALEILTLLLENPTDDSVEVAITFLREVGEKLTELSARGIVAIFERLRNVLNEAKVEQRTVYMIEVMFQVRKDKFKDHPAVLPELDLVEEDDQFTHMITLDDAVTGEEILNVFKLDPEYQDNEDKYKTIKKELLGEDSDESGDSDGDSGDESGSDDSDSEEEKEAAPIIDNTETNLIALRRTIYLTLQSSLDFEEATHKLMKLSLKPGQEPELCHMVIDCCAQQRSYEKFFALIAQRLCQVTKTYMEPFMKIFGDTYNTVHRLETTKLRNVAKFFAHLLFTDAIGWEVMSLVKMNEDDTTSSSRIFIRILWQELAEFMGLQKLLQRMRDPTLQMAFEGLFPRDNPRDTRFAINFFTSIGLGALTEDLREHLKKAPKPTAVVTPIMRAKAEANDSSSSSSSDSSSSSSDSSSSSSSSSSDSSDSEEEIKKKQKKKKESKRKGKEKEKIREKSVKKERRSVSKDRRSRRDESDERSRQRKGSAERRRKYSRERSRERSRDRYSRKTRR